MSPNTPRRSALAVLIVLALAGCGSAASKTSSGTVKSPSSESQNAKAEAADGRAAAEALICVSKTAEHKNAKELVLAFEYMLKGLASTPRSSHCPALPSAPLSGDAAKEATAVVKVYADRLAARLGWSTTERELLRVSEL